VIDQLGKIERGAGRTVVDVVLGEDAFQLYIDRQSVNRRPMSRWGSTRTESMVSRGAVGGGLRSVVRFRCLTEIGSETVDRYYIAVYCLGSKPIASGSSG